MQRMISRKDESNSEILVAHGSGQYDKVQSFFCALFDGEHFSFLGLDGLKPFVITFANL